MDTLDPILHSPLDWTPLPAPRRPRWFWTAVILGLLAMVVIGSEFVTVPYYAIAPGTAEPVASLIQVPKDQGHPIKGQILLTTVELGPVRLPELIRDWIDPNIQLVKREQILGTTPPGQLQQQNLQEMDDSKQAAVIVALRRLGQTVTETGTGALVEGVADDTPAAGRLKPGEAIVAIDGHPTTLAADAVAIIHQHKPGDVVALTVDPGGGQPTRVEQIALVGHQAALPQTSCSAPPATTTTAFLGVSLGTRDDKVNLPVQISINSQGIGGPSAGVAFTLGILAAMTSGDLTGGHKVAATGVINTDGTIGDVGGVPQKTVAVRRAGAQTFIVPCDEYHDALTKAGKQLRVVPVATLEQALAVMQSLGGNLSALPPPPASLLR